MKYKAIILFSLFVAYMPFCAKAETKQPDTYAYTRGVEAYNEQKYDDAMDWFNRELSEHPDNGYAYVYISYLRYTNQDYGMALSAIDNSLKYLPKKDKEWRSLSFASRAEIYAATGDTIKALDDLAKAIQTDPSNSKFYEGRGQIHYEQKNYALSDADYRKMIELDQDDVMGYMGIGRDANGDITEGTLVNLRTVNFGGHELENVRASVVRNQKAPLLLGQSVLGRLGKIEIDNPGMQLVITHKSTR